MFANNILNNRKMKSVYYWYVANKKEVKKIKVAKSIFNTKKIGEKLKVKY